MFHETFLSTISCHCLCALWIHVHVYPKKAAKPAYHRRAPWIGSGGLLLGCCMPMRPGELPAQRLAWGGVARSRVTILSPFVYKSGQDPGVPAERSCERLSESSAKTRCHRPFYAMCLAVCKLRRAWSQNQPNKSHQGNLIALAAGHKTAGSIRAEASLGMDISQGRHHSCMALALAPRWSSAQSPLHVEH